MKKIKIAQIGTGHDHAPAVFSTLRRLPELFEVVGCAEVPEDDGACVSEAYKGAKKYKAEELLAMKDLDAVAIETFDLNLVPYARKAAEKGLHIYMDKAAGESAEDFEKLLSVVKAKKLAFSIGYMYRFNPQVKRAFERVKNGEIGRVYSVEAEMNCYYGKEKREWLGKFRGGMMQYLGCHLIDLVVRLQGVPEKIVPYNTATGADGVRAKDFGFAVLKYKNGISTVKSSMLDACGPVRRHLLIYGEKGTIDVRPMEMYAGGDHGHLNGLTAKSTVYKPEEGWYGAGKTEESGVFDRYEEMLSAFAEKVRGERGYEPDLETEARVERCLLAADGIPCDFKAEIKL